MDKQAEQLNNILNVKSSGVSKALSSYGKSIFFPKLGILSQSKEAKGKNCNATIGVALEDDGSAMTIEVASNELKNISDDKGFLLYSPSEGEPKLRELWKKDLLRVNPSLSGKTTLPIPTVGLTDGLAIANDLFCDEADSIIIPDLYWENCDLTFKWKKYEQFELFKEGGFNLAGLKEKLSGSGKKKILVLNFPNNPAGYTPTEEEAEQIASAIKESAENDNTIVVIHDDAYFGLVYEQGVYAESLFSKTASLHENVTAVKIDGMSKYAFAFGMRLGFITIGNKSLTEEAADALEQKIAGRIRGAYSNVAKPMQMLGIKILESNDFASQRDEKFSILKERYDAVKTVFEENEKYKEQFEMVPNNSGYFMCIKLHNHNANKIREKLLAEYETGLISVGDDILRVAYSSVSKDKIPTIFENIYKACKEM